MGATSAEPMIQTRNLTKVFGRGRGRVEAVRGLDLTVGRGEIFGLVGPDGAGKTTTLQLLCGLLRPTAGEIRVAGVDVVRTPEALGGRIGYMSEGFTLYGTLTVEENLDFFAELYRVPPEVAAERKERLLAFTRLDAARDRRAALLSGGMKKKLALACTLIHRPQVLFLDEPTTGVDPVSRQEFWKILYEFLAEGVTIFLTTPYMDEAERCHRVALLHEGRIIDQDLPSRLKERLQEIALELEAEPQLRAVEMLRSFPDVAQLQVFGRRLHLLLRADGEGPEGLARRLAQGGVRVTHLAPTTPTLEDVFVAAVEARRERRFRPTAELGLGPVARTEAADDAVAVRVEGLTRRFGSFTAVDRISFSVRKGEIFGFLGPNGSGKTTTIRMLCGLLPPTEGRAWVAGVDVVRDRRAVKRRIGYMSQKFSLYLDLTVEENIQFYGDVYGLSAQKLRERKAWVLRLAGLEGKERLLARDLSGGWKQRLALGCAILHEPEVLFLDEPTSGVDPVSRREFWDLIFALASQGVTVFVTTHYMDEAEHCHTLGLLYRGRLIALGSPAALRENMRLGSLLEVPVRDPLAALKPLEGLAEVIQSSVFGDRIRVLVWEAEAGRAAVERALARDGLRTGPVRSVPIALEDLFMLFIEMDEAGRKVAAS